MKDMTLVNFMFTGPETPRVYFLAKTENLQATACNDMQSGKIER